MYKIREHGGFSQSRSQLYLDALEKLIGLLYVTNTFTLMIKRYIEFSVNWISSIQPLHYPDWVMNVHIVFCKKCVLH